MAQSLLFEVGGGSSLDRGHHRAFLAWREPQACLPHLMTPWRYSATLAPNPVPVPKNGKHLLLSAVRKPCPLTTLSSEGPYQEEPKTRAYPMLCRGVGPQTQGLLCRASVLHPVEILGG